MTRAADKASCTIYRGETKPFLRGFCVIFMNFFLAFCRKKEYTLSRNMIRERRECFAIGKDIFSSFYGIKFQK